MPAVLQDTNATDCQLVACPQCSARLEFRRDAEPQIDACGFESYSFDCQTCGTPLGGIIDPADDALLLSRAA
jgi:hypothetical protein